MKKIILLITICFTILTFNSYAQYHKLFDFDSINGRKPVGDLISDGTFLYGMTELGGTQDLGTIFKIKTDGTGYSKLLDFNFTNGQHPFGSLIYDGTFLYGTTSQGGSTSAGIIFRINPDGTSYTKLYDFGSTGPYFPSGTLYREGNYLYGTTYLGSTPLEGAIFKIKTDGTGYTNLLNSVSVINGSRPTCPFISDSTYLYGMTNGGYGSSYEGIIYRIKPDGTSCSKLYDFGTLASAPNGSLIYDGTYLYGMTYLSSIGGIVSAGAVFKIKPDGTGYIKLIDLINMNAGGNPTGSLFYDGTYLYGMTSVGSVNMGGAIFKVKTDGTGFTTLLSFDGLQQGASPFGSVISDGNFMYGMTANGGIYNKGVIFKFNAHCPLPVTQTVSICKGNSINVGSHVYSHSGTYIDTLAYQNTTITNQYCDSVVITYLTVLPLKKVSQSLTICSGQSIMVGNNTHDIFH